MLRYFKSSLLFIILLLLLSVHAVSAERLYDIKTDAEVLVFGDVHGAYDELLSLLKENNLIDGNLNWTGNNRHLVSLGDLIDRGPGSREVIDLLIKLQDQAPESGGEVHVLIGNHEQMVMTGDWNYVRKSDYAAFAPEEDAGEYENIRQKYLADHDNGDESELNEEFRKKYPYGFAAFENAFSPDGYIGQWLLEQPVILKINNTVFVHAGIPSGVAGKSLREINDNAKKELETYINVVEKLKKTGVLPVYVDFYERVPYLNKKASELIDSNPEIKRNPDKRPAWFDNLIEMHEAQKANVFSSKGPLWYRGTPRCHVFTESYILEKFLKNIEAERLVIGHTPTPNRKAMERMDGLVIMLDTGMLKDYYKGQASLLVIDNDEIFVRYAGNSEKTDLVIEERSLSRKLSGMSDAELEDFLRNGEIVEITRIGTGVTKPKKVTLKMGEKTINAVFKTFDTAPGIQNRKRYFKRRNKDADRYVYDVAAYRLDRLLDLQMVPVAILREINGKEGVLQYWVENSINERDRARTKEEFQSYCNKSKQYWLRYIFDILIYNEDRNLTNILWSKDDFMLMFIDHSLAFRVNEKRPKQYRKVTLYISDYTRKKLLALNSDNLTAELSPYLHPEQISAILKRRDLILKDGKTPS